MVKELNLATAVSRFRREVRPLVYTSKRADIKELFVSKAAAVCMREGDEALERMAEELLEALLEPTRNVKRVFDDL